MSSSSSTLSLGQARALILVAYVVATVVGYATLRLLPGHDPLWAAWWADCAATVAVFVFSFVSTNSSFYDAYWSVAPPLLGAFWWFEGDGSAPVVRKVLALSLTTLWAVRLTYNWYRGWTGLDHEDWRYVAIREKTGKLYWIVSFLGIHFFPTFQVFAGCVGLYVALTVGGRPLGLLDAVATVVTLGAIVIEAVADEQLRAFVLRPGKPTGSVMREGLWSISRHPNYFGEMSFWWGLFLFGMAADPSQLGLMIVGPLAITIMFFFVSVPLMEARQLERKPAFADHVRTTSMIIPWFPKRDA